MTVRAEAFVWSLSLIAGSSMAADHVVSLNDKYPPDHMTPNEITIAVGDTVTFTSGSSRERHNVHAYDDSFVCSVGCRGDGSGRSTRPTTNWQSTVTFTKPGTVLYGCDEHTSTMESFPAIIHVVGDAPVFNPDQAGLSGSWANPATDSQGFVLDVAPDFYGQGTALLFGGWFTYDIDAARGLRWYTIQGRLGPSNAATMGIYQTLGGRFDSAQATSTQAVGTTTVRFDDCSRGSLDYHFDDGRQGTIALTRLLNNVTCSAGNPGEPPRQQAGNAAWTGAWADVTNSGQGLIMEFNPIQNLMFAAWYTFGADGTANGGAQSQNWYTLQAQAPAGANAIHDIGIYATNGGVFDQHATTATARVGSADLSMLGCTSATLAYRFSDGANAGRAGTLHLTRLSPASTTCQLWPAGP
jgi:plastocyanin